MVSWWLNEQGASQNDLSSVRLTVRVRLHHDCRDWERGLGFQNVWQLDGTTCQLMRQR